MYVLAHMYSSSSNSVCVCVYILHSLLEDGVGAGLADDQVRPLHHHDAHKEASVASVL